MKTTPLRCLGRLVTLILIAAAVGCTTPHTASDWTSTTLADRTEILQNLASLNEVCARRDSAAFMAMFDDSDEILFVGSDKGEVFRGRAGVAAFIKILFGMPFTFSFEMPETTVRRQRDFAWAFVDGVMVRTGAAGEVSRNPYRFAVAMVRRGSTWKWQFFNGSVPGGE